MSLNVTLTPLKGEINRIPLVDVTLTKTGWAADAKETGEQLRKITGAGELSANAIAKAIAAENAANEAKATAATASSVANAAQTAVATAQSTADAAKADAATAQGTADAAMPKSGGSFTGVAKASSAKRYNDADGELWNARIMQGEYNVQSQMLVFKRK